MTIMFPVRRGAAHIAIILHDFSTGGSERIAIRLANQWVRTGRRVTIFCGTMDGPARSLIAPGVRVVSIWPEIRRSAFSRVALARAFADCVQTFAPDILFAPGNFHMSVMGLLARMLGDDRPATVCKLSNPLAPPGATPFLGSAIRRFLRPIDAFVAMSGRLRDEAAVVLRRSDIAVITEPNLDTATPAPARYGMSATILCAGRLVPQKNFLLAIRAFAQVKGTGQLRMLILGDGKQRKRLEAEADRLGVGQRVVFGGHVADIGPALSKAAMLLLSSRFEGYPAVMVEALAAGVPVLATDCSPAIREILAHPSFGGVAAADPRAMARAIERQLSAGPPDPASVAALIDRHRIDLVADQYLDLFDGLCTGHDSAISSPRLAIA